MRLRKHLPEPQRSRFEKEAAKYFLRRRAYRDLVFRSICAFVTESSQAPLSGELFNEAFCVFSIVIGIRLKVINLSLSQFSGTSEKPAAFGVI
jgi:hypothetical protein